MDRELVNEGAVGGRDVRKRGGRTGRRKRRCVKREGIEHE